MSIAANEMSAAGQRMKQALQAFPTLCAVQVKDKDFYTNILLQVRAVLAKKEAHPSWDAEDLVKIRNDIACFERVVALKTDYIAFLEEHMAAFQNGLETGANKVEGDGMHWEASDLVKFIEDDDKMFREKIGYFNTKCHVVVALASAAWVEAFGGMIVGEGKEKEAGVVEAMEKMELKGDGVGKEKGLEPAPEGEKKSGGGLKGKARKEAKKAIAAKK